MSGPRLQARPRFRISAKVLVSVGALVIAILYTWKANSLSLGSFERPGPGLFPMVVGAFFVAICCVAFVEARFESRRRAAVDSSDHDEGDALVAGEQGSAATHTGQLDTVPDYRLLVGFLVVITFHVLAFVPLGFVVSTFLSLTAISTLLGQRTRGPIVRNVIFAAALTILLYFIFGMVLDIGLPAGIYAPTVQ